MAGRLSVAHVITKLELGGAQQNTLFTVSHLNPDRFHPILITGEPGILDDEARALPGVEFHQLSRLARPIRPGADLHALVVLTTLLARLNPLIVHTHSSKAGIIGRWAARLARVPIIVHSIHGFGFTPQQHGVLRRTLIALERGTARVTTRFFAVSEANRRQGMALGIFSAERCTVIRSGVDLAAIRGTQVDIEAKRQALGLHSRAPVIGMIAPLKPQKAPLDFIHVAALVSQQKPDAQFVLVGDGELRPLVEQEAHRLGVSRALRLLGWRRDIAEILRCLDVFVMTSRWEGLPRVYLEALASGVPVVGTCVDGVPEVVRNGVNGFLVEPGDVSGMAEKILLLLENSDLAERMAQCGMLVPSEFDIHGMVRRQEWEYERLVAALPEYVRDRLREHPAPRQIVAP